MEDYEHEKNSIRLEEGEMNSSKKSPVLLNTGDFLVLYRNYNGFVAPYRPSAEHAECKGATGTTATAATAAMMRTGFLMPIATLQVWNRGGSRPPLALLKSHASANALINILAIGTGTVQTPIGQRRAREATAARKPGSPPRHGCVARSAGPATGPTVTVFRPFALLDRAD